MVSGLQRRLTRRFEGSNLGANKNRESKRVIPKRELFMVFRMYLFFQDDDRIVRFVMNPDWQPRAPGCGRGRWWTGAPGNQSHAHGALRWTGSRTNTWAVVMTS